MITDWDERMRRYEQALINLKGRREHIITNSFGSFPINEWAEKLDEFSESLLNVDRAIAVVETMKDRISKAGPNNHKAVI